jgi:hypothetical protein
MQEIVNCQPSIVNFELRHRTPGREHHVDIERLATRTSCFEKPGGFREWTFRPGKKPSYSDGGPNWPAECVTPG